MQAALSTSITEKTSESELEALIAPLCAARGIEVVMVEKTRERGALLIRVVIDREPNLPGKVVGSGVTLEDCQDVTRELSVLFDTYEADMGAYRLEVTTPGLNRPLVKAKDFQRFIGQKVAVMTHEAIDNRKRFQGDLVAFENDEVKVQVDGKLWAIAFANIKKANIVYVF